MPSSATPPAALDGLFVIELGARVGASVCGSLLAQLGAEVAYVEPAASLAGTHKGAWREQFAAGKLSLYAATEPLLQRALAQADAVIVSSDLGDDPSGPVAGLHDRAVVCDVSAFGAGAAMEGLREDLLVQALAGLVDTTGEPEGPPVGLGIPLTELMCGVYAAAATVAALRVRRLSGRGQRIDMALFDCAFASISTFIPGLMAGQSRVISRLGNRHPSASPCNAYRASDGWVLLCLGSEGHWQRLCELIGRPDFHTDPGLATQIQRIARQEEVDAAIERWTREHTVQECVATFNRLALPSGPIAQIAGWPADENLELRGMLRRLHDPVRDREVVVPGSPLRMSVSPGRAPRRIPAPGEDHDGIAALLAARPAPAAATAPQHAPALPLAGLRVIEVGHYTSVPMCARFLAQLGADVIKIEPPEGEVTRLWPPVQNGRAIFFRFNNADKRSLALDLGSEPGRQALERLLADADVLVENLKPGALARLGFPWERLQGLNPRLVYCAVSGFGAHSVYAERPAFDPIIQAMSGFMQAVRPHGDPLKSGVSSADILGTEMSLLAILAALEYRDRTGQGQFLDMSMQDVSAWSTQTAWNGRLGHAPVAHCIVRVRDGYVLALCDAARAARACGGEAPALARDAACAALRAAGIAAAPVLDVKEAVFLPHTRARRLWSTLEEEGERWPVMANPLRLGATPPRVARLAPPLNADGPQILAALGLAPEVSPS